MSNDDSTDNDAKAKTAQIMVPRLITGYREKNERKKEKKKKKNKIIHYRCKYFRPVSKITRYGDRASGMSIKCFKAAQ